MNNVKISFLFYATTADLCNCLYYKLIFHLDDIQNIEKNIHVFHTLQDLMELRINQNLHCTIYMEATLDGFCMGCRAFQQPHL